MWEMNPTLNFRIMNAFLDILNNPNETFSNDFCTINLLTQEVIWKPGKFNPKMSNSIQYWFNEKNK